MQIGQQRFETLKLINNRKFSRLVHNHSNRAITFKTLVSRVKRGEAMTFLGTGFLIWLFCLQTEMKKF